MYKLSMRKYLTANYKLCIFTSVIFISNSLSSIPVSAQGRSQTQLSGRAQSPDEADDPVKTCMAAQSEQAKPAASKKGPIKVVAKALASEFGADSKNMLRDSILVFSAQDIDPYDRSAPKDKPYTLCEARLMDGSMASVIKYPDGSGKVVGGFADGTIIAPSGKNTYIVAYPNGVRGKLVKESSSLYKIYRPDHSITIIKKTMSGSFDISNDKIGNMGTLRTDQLGMQYEFNSSTF